MSDNSKMQGQKRLKGIHPQSGSDRAIASLVRALQSDEPNALSCAECREQMATLYEMTRAEKTPAPPLEAVAAHLAHCPACAAEYQALVAAMTAFELGVLPELAATEEFDLSFLRPSPPAVLWSQTISSGVWRFFEEVRILLRATGASFASLQEYLLPANTAGALLRTDVGNSKTEVLMLPAPDAEFSVHVAVGPTMAGFAAVSLKFLDLASTKPLVHLHVTLRNGQRQLLVGASTGQDGSAVFEQLACGRYFIQVRHQQQLWEIPLVLIEGNEIEGNEMPT